ncbi:amidohydrolase family protein [Subtercola sp. PAMC28395]|uniref:amidohydrolase n=1 Tax=Subtercola sp. PAMC28395 TaxID=2846775 RepID=UPI001C0BF539|nr:amidohydrolase family protein [Subtercola sp. PAMC28395]QWT22929.1 amidohydrolase family protein [Subtercola sp. PAMC28395]
MTDGILQPRGSRPESAPDVFLRGGRVPGNDAEIDVLLADGRIRAIMPSSIVRPPATAEVHELDGRFFMPGLWDNHVHFTQWALFSRRVDLSGAESARDVEGLLRAHRQAEASGREPAGGAIIGVGVRDGMWADPGALDRHLLDRVSPGHPVILASGDLHGCWLNSAALALHGLGDHPTGHLREDDCFAVLSSLDDVPEKLGDAFVADAAAAAARRGIVGIVDLEMRDNLVDWTRRIAAGTTALRVSFGIYTERLEQSIAAGLRTGDVIPGTNGLLSVGPFKVITDGSLGTRTAYCFDEYEGFEGHAHSRGMLTVAPDALLSLLERATGAGLTPAVHAIGDHANRLALDAFEALGRGGRIEHAQLLTVTDLARFAALGVVASVQPEHAMDDRDIADRYWAGRTDRAFVFESLRASGAALLLGSDAPVAPLDPWVTLAAAIGRSRDGRAPWHPEQRLAFDAALAASTNGVAAIGVGLPADVVVTELDPTDAAPGALRTMPVAATFLAGRPTHLAL